MEKSHTAALEFVTSAADVRGAPGDALPEIALVGRSNSGKSSFINGLSGRRLLAKVSSKPGKTRLLNFFSVGDKYRFVDMPGYGFAARSDIEQREWQLMVEGFLATRPNLCGLLLLMDARRDWTLDEAQLLKWLRPRKLPVALVLTKTDKLSKSEWQKRLKELKAASGLKEVYGTSTLNATGFASVENFAFVNWVKPRIDSPVKSEG